VSWPNQQKGAVMVVKVVKKSQNTRPPICPWLIDHPTETPIQK
jgi:hypothetical protein